MNTVLKAEIPEKGKVIAFPRGIPGGETFHRFIVEPIPENRLFALLQAVEDAGFGLILVDPMPFFPDYTLCLSRDDCADLQVTSPEEALIYTTVTIEDKQLFTNLAAPILINPAKLRGKQVILPDRVKEIRVPLVFPPSQK